MPWRTIFNPVAWSMTGIILKSGGHSEYQILYSSWSSSLSSSSSSSSSLLLLSLFFGILMRIVYQNLIVNSIFEIDCLILQGLPWWPSGLRRCLTLMLLVANLANTKWCINPGKWSKPWQMGAYLRVLSESFLMSTNMTGFRCFSKIFAYVCFGGK